ncbi:allantoate transport protein [Pyrenophora tritici-repentis Pt-1C-BFP]|uniref:Allantoate transport protein n=1 Tax=Pyrenophora tritici-repentis (strain Pt-1C-BFP) TaxID=426418 RepID=B2WKX5_PYRTR|nr:allantoate transport protein [Pyrenophora tritici-repentis Pt-1C-BFP]EDU43685.1 allantoate transport protein [Pyrenophora tritici-repentis Pt-1C-BFP]
MSEENAVPTHVRSPSCGDKVMTKRVNRKMDIALLPFLSLLYLFNGLDRSNVGNAETQAFGIFHLNETRLKNWQYLFIIEGGLTILVALVAWFWLPRGPGSAWFLNSDEQKFVVRRIRKDNISYVTHEYGTDGVERDRLTKRDIVETAKDWKLFFLLIFNICASVPSQAFSVFMPMVVQGLGYSSIQANLMSVPPFICGAIGLYLFALSSDYRKERGYHIIVGIFISLIGLIITVTTLSHGAQYAGLCILLFGSYISAPLTLAWLSGNNPVPEPGKRSVVVGVNGFGNFAGVIGSQLYKKRYAPRYLTPFYATLGFVVAALVGYIAYKFILKAVNAKKLQMASGKTAEQAEAERLDGTRYADAKWTFLYGL